MGKTRPSCSFAMERVGVFGAHSLNGCSLSLPKIEQRPAMWDPFFIIYTWGCAPHRRENQGCLRDHYQRYAEPWLLQETETVFHQQVLCPQDQQREAEAAAGHSMGSSLFASYCPKPPQLTTIGKLTLEPQEVNGTKGLLTEKPLDNERMELWG